MYQIIDFSNLNNSELDYTSFIIGNIPFKKNNNIFQKLLDEKFTKPIIFIGNKTVANKSSKLFDNVKCYKINMDYCFKGSTIAV